MDASRQSVSDTGVVAIEAVAGGGGRESADGTGGGGGESSSLRESVTLVEAVGGSREESERESVVAADGKRTGSVMEEASLSVASREGNSVDGGDEEGVRREICGDEIEGEQVPANVEHHDDDVWEVGVHNGQTRQSDIEMAVKMVKAVEDDARAVAGSLSMLFSSLQAGLTPVTDISVQHMQCYSEAAGLLQDAAIDAATKGNRFVNACLRLNEEMKGMGNLAAQLKNLRQVVDQFDYQVSRILPRL